MEKLNKYTRKLKAIKWSSKLYLIKIFVVVTLTLCSIANHLNFETSSEVENKLIFVLTGRNREKWFDVAFKDIREGKCPESRCILSYNPSDLLQADSIVAGLTPMVNLKQNRTRNYSIREQILLLPLAGERPESLRHQIWVMFYYEPATQLVKLGRQDYNSMFPDTFNWTMTLRSDSEVRVRNGEIQKRPQKLSAKDLEPLFPSWTGKQSFKKYSFTQNASDDTIVPIVLFSSHCLTSSGRELYVDELSNHIGIHTYGKCGSKTCSQRRYLSLDQDVREEPCFEEINQNYAFMIAFENSLCKDYATEKVFNALLYNSIPLVLSGNLELDIYPPHSVIYVADFHNPKKLSEYLYYLIRNETAYMEYFDWRREFLVDHYFSRPDPCQLCHRLHHEKEYTKAADYSTNLQKWLLEDSECLANDLPNFINETTNLTSILKVLSDNITVPKDPIVQNWIQKHRIELEI